MTPRFRKEETEVMEFRRFGKTLIFGGRKPNDVVMLCRQEAFVYGFLNVIYGPTNHRLWSACSQKKEFSRVLKK